MTVALAVLALVVALLALTVALAAAARLREATTRGTLGLPVRSRAPLPELNQEFEAFVAQRTDGSSFDNTDIAVDDQLIGFFSVGCSTCKDELPHFLAVADEISADRPRPVAVLSGHEDGIDELAEQFPAGVTVVVEPDAAFSHSAGVRAYPTFIVADHGRVKTAAVRVDRLFALR
jgi:thiol-disulfide isomerase/thioredoxin